MAADNPRMRFLLLVVLLGCSTTRNPEACLEGLCPDPALPFCDTDGSLSGAPNTCIAVDCAANTFQECREDRALICNGTGDNYDLVQCEFGCDTGGCKTCNTPECEIRIVPKYTPVACNELATGSLTISQNTLLDTSNDAMCTAIVDQPTGPDLCLLKFRTIVIETNQTLKVVGSRGIALVADYALDIKGTIDVSADLSTNGPAGGVVKSGMMVSPAASGGAGYRHRGGDGGGATNGGPAQLTPLSLTDLFGGTQVAGTSGYGLPGGAGGAFTAVSCRGKLSVQGMIDAGGGGGAGAKLMGGGPIPTLVRSSGGGTGGTIVLQGLNVDITGQLFANGGGGGGSGTGTTPGQDGQRSVSAALGGSGQDSDSGACNGGRGGTDSVPLSGQAATNTAGSGGASAGYIAVYAPSFSAPITSPVSASPTIEATQTVPTNRVPGN